MKKIFFDTSVLIAGMTTQHIHFVQSSPWLSLVANRVIKGFISTHTLAEFYANLTRMPHTPSVTPLIAQKMIKEWVLEYCTPIALDHSDYLLALDRIIGRSLRGGVIYDSLHLQAALKQKVHALVSLNERDFARLVDSQEIRLINPLTESPHFINRH